MSERRDDSLSLGALLRAAADDELTPAQREALDAHLREHPEDGVRIAFERSLREGIGRVMGGIAAPEGLRSRIEREARATPEVVARPAFWRSRRGLALAASLVLISGLLVALAMPSSPIGPDARYRASLVRFLDGEHKRCWVDADWILDKFKVRERDALPGAMSKVFGRDVEVPVVRDGDGSGLIFEGAGECHVPGRGKSMHFGFRTDGTRAEAGVAVSLFVQPNTTRLELEDGVTYRLTSEHGVSRGVCSIYAWTRDGMIYFLVSDDAGACDLGLEALDAPTTLGQL